MKIALAYAEDNLILDIPASIHVDIFSPTAVQNPLGVDAFSAGFLRAGGDRFLTGEPPLIVVNDGYRNTPTDTILRWLDQLGPGVVDSARFIISTGAHAAPAEEHYHKIFRRLWERVRDNVSYHDAGDRSRMTLIGRDGLGGEVWVNRAVLENKKILVIGSVEPHYFAGFTGGRKAIFPGLTDFDTVARNHNLANSLKAAPLKLEGNPVAEHLDSLMAVLDPDKFFGIQIVTDSRRQIAGLYFGRLDVAFKNASAMAEKIYSYQVSKRYDAVICEVLPPLDKNLYQAQKALENCQKAARDGGTIIIVSACEEGIGSEHFFQLADIWDRQANRAKDGRQHFGSHKLSRVISIRKRVDTLLHSTLPDSIIRHVFYEPLDNPQFFLYSIGKECENYHLAVVHDAANMVLKVEND
jgi:nickel-dependent lactate racemase